MRSAVFFFRLAFEQADGLLLDGGGFVKLLRLGICGGQSVEKTWILTMGCGDGLLGKEYGVRAVPNFCGLACGLKPCQIVHRLEGYGVLRA